MEKSKEIYLVRKRNAELSKENETLKFDIEQNKTLNMKTSDKAKGLICEFETVKKQWEQLMNELNEKRDEYQKLIKECKNVRNEVSELKAQMFQNRR